MNPMRGELQTVTVPGSCEPSYIEQQNRVLQVGGTLDPHKHLYIERREVEDEVYRLLARGEYCNILCSRQVGKSSLMVNTALRLRAEKTRVVTMDIGGELGTPQTSTEWYRGLLRKLCSELEIKLDIDGWWEHEARGTANQRLLQFFRDHICVEGLPLCVVFLDEIDSTLKLGYTDDFFTAIRTMYNERSMEPRYRNIAFCLIGVATTNELIKNPRTTSYNVGRTIELRDFDTARDDLSPLTEVVDSDGGDGKSMVDEILYWTGGHPFLTLQLCQEVIEQGIKTPEKLDQTVKTKFANLDSARSEVHFQQIERFLGNRISDKLATLRLYERIRSGKKVRDETALTHVQLKLSGLVKRDENGCLVVRNRIYEKIFNLEWVRSTKPQRTVQRLRQFAITVSVLLVFLVIYVLYHQLLLEPPRRLAKHLEGEIRAATDERDAYRFYEYLSGAKEHPILLQNPLVHPKKLQDYKELALLAYKDFLLKLEEISQKNVIDNSALKKWLALRKEADESSIREVNTIVITIQGKGFYKICTIMAEQVRFIARTTLSQEHLARLNAENNLASIYRKLGRYSEAETILKNALSISEKFHGSDHPSTLSIIDNLTELYRALGRYGEAEPLLQRALIGYEKVLGVEHPSTLLSVNNLALLYQAQGRYGEAEPLYQRALAAFEKVLGPEHPGTLTSVNNLAALYDAQGRYGEAEPLYQRALAAREQVLGAEHPDTLSSVNNLALLYQAQGRYGEAEPLYQRALAAFEKVLGPEHPDTLQSVNNLAVLYQSQGRYGEAEPLLQRVLAARERVLGPEHPDTLVSVNNLAELYRVQGRYGEAEPLYQRALAARERVLGPEHPSTLVSVNNLAMLYQAQGRYGEAEPLLQRALAAREKVLGAEHPNTLATQLNYTGTLVNLNQPKRALRQLKRMEPRLLELAALRLRHTQQESVRRQFLSSQSDFQAAVLTLALRYPEPDFLDLAANVMLRWKQIQGEEDASLGRLIRRESKRNPEISELAKQIRMLRRDLSNLYNRSEPGTEEDREKLIDIQRAKLEELETKEIRLAEIGEDYNRYLQVQQANVDKVRDSLPSQDSALLELRQYQPYYFRTGQLDSPRWAALLLPKSGEMSLHDLGPVAETEKLWRDLQATGSRDTTAELYQNLFGKLDEELKRHKTLYLAPDGFLNLIAFARLVTPEGKYWIERPQLLRYVRTGRDLIGKSNETTPTKGLLALGGINYDSFDNGVPNKSQTATSHLPKLIQVELNTRKDEYDVIRAFKLGFNTLPYSQKEVEEIASYYWDERDGKPTIWLGAEASEARLKALKQPPWVLHLATHSFYRDDQKNHQQRPMAFSGLVLAGANKGLQGIKGPNGEDGILYAIEIQQQLNLEGTELVTLSACDTGRGVVDYSEGVYGLVRAFRTTGVRNILMTLWAVNDSATREFMRRFYGQYWLGYAEPQDLAVALRDTQLSFINDSNEALRHPRVWAPFVLIESH